MHFYTLLLNGIPEALQEEMSTNAYSVLDFGCAQGEGTNFFAKMLSKILDFGGFITVVLTLPPSSI